LDISNDKKEIEDRIKILQKEIQKEE